LRPPIGIKRRGTAEATIMATMEACGLLANKATASGNTISAMTVRAVIPTASGQARMAIAVTRKSNGVGLGIDAMDELVLIQVIRNVLSTLP
jgi:hypothetical protein